MAPDESTTGHDVVVGASAGDVDARRAGVANRAADALGDAAFNASPLAQLVVDRDGKLALANLQARTLFDLAARDVGRPFNDLDMSYRPVDLPSRIERVYTERQITALRDVEFRPGPDVRYMDVQIAPLITSTGACVGAGITFTDVTRYRRLQQALQESKREMATAYEELQSTVEELEMTNDADHVDAQLELASAPDSPVLSYPADVEQLGLVVDRLPIGVILFGCERLDVAYVNNAARRLFYPEKVRARRALPDPWPSFSLRDYAQRLVERGFAPDRRVELEDDRVFVFSGIVSRGANTAVLLIEDVSQQERRLRAEREFVANAAHELLTPLTGIVSATHVLQAGAKAVPEDRDKFIAHIAYECSRLTRMARSLLVLARAQSGEEPPRIEIVAVRELLDAVVEQTRGNVRIRCRETVTALADFDLFVQAGVNLVSNALRHGSGPEVVIEARESPPNVVQIDIVDDRHRKLDLRDFRRRFRTGGGRDAGGFGLGLSIAGQSLEVMGGRLLFDGAAARIELPRGGTSG